jgi:thiol-disulfide isomerase/thioredoxin
MKLPFTCAFLGLCLSLGVAAQTVLPHAPERAELAAANRIDDLSARLKELRRIKAAYPESTIMYSIDLAMLDVATRNANTLDNLLAAQGEVIKSGKTLDRFRLIANAASMIFAHPKIGDFPKPALLKAIQDYKAEGMPLLAAPEFAASIAEGLRSAVLDSYKTVFDVPLAKAQMMNGDGPSAVKTLEGYAEATRDGDYFNTLGLAYLSQKRDKDALDAFFQAAAEGNKSALESAKTVYTRLNGSGAKFDAELENRRAQRPFTPPQFKAPENWEGKTVLAEVFTGSECPPCVAATFAFDGLKESYPAKYLAVLKYHLPIPRYDPMMNPATKKRQDYYGPGIIRGTPTAIIDGAKTVSVGGARLGSFASFNAAKKEIDALLGEAADLSIKASASLSGGKVQVDCEFSKVLEGADYNVALVQAEEIFKGGNGIIYHKMVVRDIETVSPSDKASVTSDLAESEKAADAFIAEWGKTAPQGRLQGTSWPAKHNKIGRSNLKAVVFVQDKNTKQVHNAFVADVAVAGGIL